MKIVLLLSALSLPSVTSSSLRRIQTTQCLTDGVDQITFQSTCSQESVEANVEAALLGTGCAHSALNEIKILSGNTHSWQAKQFLVDHCNTLEFDPCLGGLDAVTFRGICDHTSVYEDLEAALLNDGTCVHGVDKELKLIANNNHAWHAKNVLVAHCKALDHSSCLDKTSIEFRSACSTDSVVDDVEDALVTLGSCAHEAEREVELLTDITGNSWQAKVALTTLCKSREHDACLDKDTMAFTSACSTDSVKQDVETALVAAGCGHGTDREIVLLTGEQNAWKSKVALSNHCKTLAFHPCLDIATMSFTSTCSTDSVKQDVETALTGFGCAHGADREIGLLTDEPNGWKSKVALATHCEGLEHGACLDKTQIEFSTACSTDSVYVDVQSALTTLGACAHEVDREIELLAGKTNNWQAKVELSTFCKTLEHVSCLELATMSFTSTCSTDSVKQDVETALTGSSCGHDADREIALLTSEESSWNSKVALATHCEGLVHGSCLDKATIDFSSACSTDSVVDDVGKALTTLGTCAHGAGREVELLTGIDNNWNARVELSSFCKTLDHDSCLALATMDFASTCSTDSVKQDIETALTGTTCAHDADREIVLLTDEPNDWKSKVALAAHCEGLEHGSCLDKASIDFTSACSTDSVVDDVGKALTTLGTCVHDASREVELLAGVNNNWNARVELAAFCKTFDHEACLTKNTIPFASTCTPDSVEQDLTSALAGVTCAHETTREMELLTDKSGSWDAKVALKDFCRTLDHDECLDLKTLVFPNCEDDTFVSVIDTALAAASCPHDLQMELFIHTDIANSWESKREVINTVCVQSLTPCLSVEDLLIFNCDRGLITDVVTAALPDTCTHDVEQEIELLGNNTHSWQASVAISEECHTYIQPCTSPTPQDYIVDNCMNPLNVVKELLAADTNCLTHNKYTMEIVALTGKPDTTSAVDHIKAECITSRVSCTKDSWDDTMVNGCDWSSFVEHVKDQMALPGVTCYHKWETEIELLTGSAVDDQEAARTFITTMCDGAWTGVTTSKFTDISETIKPPVFTDDFLDEYTMGDTFLNTETGNFQGPENQAYPDSQMDPRTRGIGSDIDYYLNGDDDGDRDGVGATTILESFTALASCPTAILCCFGRDRQSKDNNGDCKQNDCANKGPADNSNLCFVEEPEFMAYPNADEGSIHCHGLTWSEDINDFSQRLRFNNFFFVSLYDHMYSRGYVEPMIEDNQVLPMCDCIEEMPPVVRSDCTQLDVELNFAVNTDSNGLLTAATEDDMKIAFNACRGNPNNDLAAYAKKLHRHEEISEATYETILDTIIGEIGGGNDQEGVCEAAVESY